MPVAFPLAHVLLGDSAKSKRHPHDQGREAQQSPSFGAFSRTGVHLRVDVLLGDAFEKLL